MNYSFDSAQKAVKLWNRKSVTAICEDEMIAGDYVLTVQLKNNDASSGNQILFYFNYADSGDYLAFVLCGDRTVKLLKNGAAVAGLETRPVSGTNANACQILIQYLTEGTVKAYEATASGEQLLFRYSDPELANKSGKIGAGSSWGAGSVGNIMMFRAFAGSYDEDFEDSARSSDWTLPGHYGFIQLDYVNNGKASIGLGSSESEAVEPAALNAVYTTGSFFLSMDFQSLNQNAKRFYFNRSGGNAWYALEIPVPTGEGSLTHANLIKSDGTTLAAYQFPDGSKQSSLHHIEISYSAQTQLIQVYFNGQKEAALSAVDGSYTQGRFYFQFDWAKGNVGIDNLHIESREELFRASSPLLTGRLENGESLTASADVINTTAEDRTVSLILALYERECLIGAVSQEYKLPARSGWTQQTLRYPIGNQLQEDHPYCAKCFLFDGIVDQLKPLARPPVLYNTSKILLMGDSICQDYGSDGKPAHPQRRGWGQYFQELFDETFVQVVNRAYSGYTVDNYIQADGWAKEGGWAKLQEMVSPGDTVLLDLGINDKAMGWDKYQNGLRTIIDDAKKKGIELILITPTTGAKSGWSYQEAAEKMKEVAAEKGVPCLDLNTRMISEMQAFLDAGSSLDDLKNIYYEWHQNPDDPSLLECDGIHLNETGARYVRDLIVGLLRESDTHLGKKLRLLK